MYAPCSGGGGGGGGVATSRKYTPRRGPYRKQLEYLYFAVEEVAVVGHSHRRLNPTSIDKPAAS